MARWKAWLCRLGRPGTTTPETRSAGPPSGSSTLAMMPWSIRDHDIAPPAVRRQRQFEVQFARHDRVVTLSDRHSHRMSSRGVFGMKTVCRIAALAAFLAGSAASAQQLAPSPTLDAIKARGHIECGVHLGLPGFSFANDKGEWSGLDVDYCKSLAAAVLGDATKVKFTPTSVQQRWAVLQSGQVDLLSRPLKSLSRRWYSGR